MKGETKFIVVSCLIICVFITVFDLVDRKIKKNSDEIVKNEISSNEAEFLYGSWKIDKLLGFTDIQTPICNYPYGQDIIDDVLVIDENFFSSMDLDYDFGRYQSRIKNPCYVINYTNEEMSEMAYWRWFGVDPQKIGINPEVGSFKSIRVEESNSPYGMAGELIIVNDEKLIWCIDSAYFELIKMDWYSDVELCLGE